MGLVSQQNLCHRWSWHRKRRGRKWRNICYIDKSITSFWQANHSSMRFAINTKSMQKIVTPPGSLTARFLPLFLATNPPPQKRKQQSFRLSSDHHDFFSEVALPETNIASENRPSQKKNSSSNNQFSGAIR